MAVVMCRHSVVCWCVRLDWLGWDWDWDARQSMTNDDFIVRRLFATSLTATWHLEGALARGTDGDQPVLLSEAFRMDTCPKSILYQNGHFATGQIAKMTCCLCRVPQ